MIFKFSWRYFRGKKSTQAIQIIAWVSVLAMSIGSAALIIVLSVFNGFEFFIKDLYSNFYPDTRITAQQGKYFQANPELLKELSARKEIHVMSFSLEEKVLLNFEGRQAIVTLKGIDSRYDSTTHFMRNVRYGSYTPDTGAEFAPLMIGIQMGNTLGVSEESPLPLNVYAFRKGSGLMSDPTQVYNNRLMQVQALYSFQSEMEGRYAFAPLEEVQQLSEKQEQYSSIEIRLQKGVDAEKFAASIQNVLRKYGLLAEDRYKQNKTLYFILKSEKLAVFALLSMMLLIASFNLVGSLSMLVIEKEKDISILKTLGMPDRIIRRIFLSTGVLITLTGSLIGCVLAIIICLLQQHFGFVKLGDSGSFLVEAYPVRMQVMDFVLVICTSVIIAVLASWVPALKAGRKPIELRVR